MNRSDEYEDIRKIADDVCDETVTPEQIQKLEALLAGNESAQKFYHDYISMHVHLKPDVQPNFEYVYRKITQEVIVRPQDKNHKSILKPYINPQNSALTYKDETVSKNSFTGLVLKKPIFLNKVVWLPFLVLVFLFLIFFIKTVLVPSTGIGKMDNGQLSIVELGDIDGRVISAGEYKAEQDTVLKLNAGGVLSIDQYSVIKFFNDKEFLLKQGALSIDGVINSNLIVHNNTFSVYTNGDDISLNLTQEKPLLKTGQNTQLLSYRWRPSHYWSFDGRSDRVLDFAGNAHGIVSKGASRAKGLLGSGAFYFDNSPTAHINVGSGGGTAIATGSFAVSDGISIEALITPEFTGKKGDLDEIFRIDQPDQTDLRILLSFQNDSGKPYLRPQGDFKESLSFGLYLLGQDYHELKLPLDGKEGRPSLSDMKNGEVYHVVATYSVQSGLKAIYIDGKRQAYYQYPAGSKMLSGGSGLAQIGNSPIFSMKRSASHYRNEAFYGVIDEVAFYDFALPPMMISDHYNQTVNGKNYYGLNPSAQNLPEKNKLLLPAHSVIELDLLTGLPEKIVE